MEQVSEELKSEHLWSMVEDFTREGRWPENEDDAPNDFNTPDFVARAMLDDLRTLRAQLAAALAEVERLNALGIAQLERDKAMLQARVWELEAAQEWEVAEPGRILLDASGDNMNISLPAWIEWLGGDKIIVVMRTLSMHGAKHLGYAARVRGDWQLMRRKEATNE